MTETPKRRDKAGWKPCAADIWRVAGLWVLAVAEPIFAVLRTNPEVLMARPGSPGRGAWLLVLVLCVLVPAVLGAVIVLARLVAPKLGRGVARVLVGILLGAIVMQLMLHLGDHWAWLTAGISLTAGIAAAIWLYRPMARRFANIVGAAILVSPALFLASPKIAELWLGGSVARTEVEMPAKTPPVVFVLFDEFQLASLLDERARINRALYPNFAALAEDATWYRNARSVASGTTTAVPAVLEGMMPGQSGPSPVTVNYPRNLFTMMGASKPLHVVETLTRLCPPALCAHTSTTAFSQSVGLVADTGAIYLHRQLPDPWSGWLPDIDQTWGHFWGPGTAFFPKGWLETAQSALRSDRAGQFRNWAETIRSADDETFHFIHSPLPHTPLVYYPDGQRYPYAGLYMAPDQVAVEEPFQILRAYQRHVLQSVFTDRLIGKLLERLKAQGLYEQSLIVIAADHGVHYGSGVRRRDITPQGADDVLRVPLLIKQPGQTEGRVDDRLAYTIDIVPTLLDALEVRHDLNLDGQSLLNEPKPRQPLSAIDTHGQRHERPLGSGLEHAFEPTGGIARLGRANDVAALYALGEHADLIGHSLEDLDVAEEPAPNKLVWLRDQAALFKAPYASAEIPGFILGVYRSERPRFDAALALNNKIVAVTHSFYTNEDQHRFRFLVPPETFDESINEIRIFRIGPQNVLKPIYRRLASTTK